MWYEVSESRYAITFTLFYRCYYPEADFGDTYTGVTVTATDDDAGNNAAIRYKIEGDLPNLYFEVCIRVLSI